MVYKTSTAFDALRATYKRSIKKRPNIYAIGERETERTDARFVLIIHSSRKQIKFPMQNNKSRCEWNSRLYFQRVIPTRFLLPKYFCFVIAVLDFIPTLKKVHWSRRPIFQPLRQRFFFLQTIEHFYMILGTRIHCYWRYANCFSPVENNENHTCFTRLNTYIREKQQDSQRYDYYMNHDKYKIWIITKMSVNRILNTDFPKFCSFGIMNVDQFCYKRVFQDSASRKRK